MARQPEMRYRVSLMYNAAGAWVGSGEEKPTELYARGLDGAVRKWNKRNRGQEYLAAEGEQYEVAELGPEQYVTITDKRVTTKLTVEVVE